MMISERIRGRPQESWEERFPRYAHNAAVTAGYAEKSASQQNRNAGLAKRAADNARNHGDERAASLYMDIHDAALDAADALDDLATCARLVAAHYAGHENNETKEA